jgi:prevent-host-death family protein
MSERTVSVADAVRELAELVEAARTRHESTVLVKDGEPVAKIVPYHRGITGRDLAEN